MRRMFAGSRTRLQSVMDHRRQLVMFVLMLGIFLVWINVAPRLFPQLFPDPAPLVDDVPPAGVVDEDAAGDAAVADAGTATDAGDAADPQEAATVDAADEDAPEPAEIPRFPARTILLGGTGPDHLQQLSITSAGAAIEWQELMEEKYKTVDRKSQLRLLGTNPLTDLRTLSLSSTLFDVQLQAAGTSLERVDWEFVEAESERIPNTEAWRKVVFRYPAPDGSVEARKTYSVQSAAGVDSETNPQGYLVDVELTFRNLQDVPREFTYSLQGPVGLPLEHLESIRIYRETEAGTLEDPADPGDVSHVQYLAGGLVSEISDAREERSQPPKWAYPVRWAGVDVQYFTALLIPAEDQITSPYFRETVPTVVRETDPVEQSDVSVRFESNTLKLAAGADQSLTHKFQLFVGPKRTELLKPFQAEDVISFGWFGAVSKVMLWLLGFFHHSLLLPYGIAIILLTVIVRGCMFPISKKQVANVQKMKEINPKLQEIRTKYANDKEAMTRAQLELMRKHGYNPLAGCLPLLLQLPIFIGLYNALNNAVDLRLARFLWIDDLAAPDALFIMPFEIPFLGKEFNLLPLITIVLFIIQNKLFTPPPTNEEQALQQKMMNFMMIFFGVMFYHVPAGLCVYFIASSLWGICERKLLDRHRKTLELAGVLNDGGDGGGGPPKKPDAPVQSKPPGLLARMLAAADQAKHPANGQGLPSGRKSDRDEKERSKNRR
jgi:YidC/Oxa1 family membrane protein insertase